MRILIVTALNITPFCGGIERFSLELGNRFSADGHEVSFMSFMERKNVQAVQQHYFPDERNYSSEKNISFLNSFILEKDIDVILNQQADSLDIVCLCDAARKGTKAKLVSVFHFDPMHYIDIYRASYSDIMSAGLSLSSTVDLLFHNIGLFRSVQRKKCGKRYSQVYNLSDAFVLLSESAKSSFVSMADIVDDSKLYAISNPLTNRKNDDVGDEKENMVLFVGRLNFLQKRPDLLLKVWTRIYKRHGDWKCVVLGNGEYFNTMQKKIKIQGIENIELVGFADSEEYYKRGKILCVTSNTEGFGLVITEASSYGVVPFAFDSFKAVSDVIDDGKTGVVVPAFDVDAYAEKLSVLMMEDERLTKMSQAAKKYSENFRMDKIVVKWYELLDSLMPN